MPYKNREDRLKWSREKYAKSEFVRKQTLLRQKKRRKLNPYPLSPERAFKQNARKKLARALKSGKVKKLPCRDCNELNVEAHHPDYSKPMEVIWLCKKHHGEIHREY